MGKNTASNKYNVRAIRKNLEGHVRIASWVRLRSDFLSVSADPPLAEAVALQRSKSGGSLLHSIVTKCNRLAGQFAQTPPPPDLVRDVAAAAPSALTTTWNGRTPLMVAVGLRAPPPIISALLEHDPEGCSLTISDRWGDTPLLAAVKKGLADADDVATILIDKDRSGQTLLTGSRRSGRVPLWYVAAEELRFGFHHDRDDALPPALENVLLRTNAALIARERGWVGMTDDVVTAAAGCGGVPRPPLAGGGGETADEESSSIRSLRAAISCAHLLGKCAPWVVRILVLNCRSRDDGGPNVDAFNAG